MEDNQFEASPQFASAPKKKINKRFIYLLAAFGFILIAIVGYRLIGGSSKSDNFPQEPLSLTPTLGEAPTDTPTPTIEETPTTAPTSEPTEKPTPKVTSSANNTSGLDRSDLTITVQNGSGEAGVASTAKEFLTDLGYDVASTGNADNYDYLNVTIRIKKSSQEFLSLLKKDLNTKYTVGDTSTDLEDSNSSDALVIIGK